MLNKVVEEAATALVLLALDRAKLFLPLLDHQPVQLAGKGSHEAASWKMQAATWKTWTTALEGGLWELSTTSTQRDRNLHLLLLPRLNHVKVTT
jgi:hypothetical protein